MSNARHYPAIRPMPESQDLYQPQPFNPALEYRPEEDLFLDPALTQSTFDTFSQPWDRRQSYDVPQAQYCASDSSDASAENIWRGGVVDWGDTQRKADTSRILDHSQTSILTTYSRPTPTLPIFLPSTDYASIWPYPKHFLTYASYVPPRAKSQA